MTGPDKTVLVSIDQTEMEHVQKTQVPSAKSHNRRSSRSIRKAESTSE
jgi:hypothetical protein